MQQRFLKLNEPREETDKSNVVRVPQFFHPTSFCLFFSHVSIYKPKLPEYPDRADGFTEVDLLSIKSTSFYKIFFTFKNLYSITVSTNVLLNNAKSSSYGNMKKFTDCSNEHFRCMKKKKIHRIQSQRHVQPVSEELQKVTPY